MQKGYWPLLIVVLIALIAYAFALLAQAQPGGVGGGYAYYTPAGGTDGAGALNPGLRISLSADRAIGGQAVAVDILAGDCARGGALEVVHNGQVVARNLTLGEDTLSVPLVAQNGDNLVQVSGNGCSANLEFMAGPAECAVGANRTCPMPNNCPGVQACQGGLWSDCQGLEHICRPGRQVPCDLDACSFGVSICNSCGTGWGPCVAPQ